VGDSKEQAMHFQSSSFLIRSSLFILIALSITGCGKKELDRSSAKTMIEGHAKLKELAQNLPLNSVAVGKARALDMLSRNGALTPKGSKLFSKFNNAGATLVHPVSLPSVDVTGITSVPMSEDMKEVQFELTFQLPPEIKRFAAKGGTGVAHFRRYDDGWRLEGVNVSISKEPYPLTVQEASDELADLSAAASERAKLKADLQKLVEQSRVPKQSTLKFVTGDMIYSYASDHDIKELTLFDTEIYLDVMPSPYEKSGSSSHIWFGNVQELSKYYNAPDFCSATEQDLGWRGREHLYRNIYSVILVMNTGAKFVLKFPKEENCREFNKKFTDAFQSWRNTYSAAFKSLAEMQ